MLKLRRHKYLLKMHSVWHVTRKYFRGALWTSTLWVYFASPRKAMRLRSVLYERSINIYIFIFVVWFLVSLTDPCLSKVKGARRETLAFKKAFNGLRQRKEAPCLSQVVGRWCAPHPNRSQRNRAVRLIALRHKAWNKKSIRTAERKIIIWSWVRLVTR